MRRLLSVCSLLFMVVAVPAATEIATAAPAAAAGCPAGTIATVKSVFIPNPTTPGTNTTNKITVTNCTNQTQTFSVKGNVFGPSNCPPGIDFGPITVTVAPLGKSVTKATFPAPDCKGTYTQNVQVYQGSTLVAHQRVTFVVS